MSNEVYVGGKSLGSYVSAINHQLDENDECVVLSRGKDKNSKAIDAACIAKRKGDGVDVSDFDLYTEAFYENDDGEQVEIGDEGFEQYEEDGYEVTKVSAISITLER